MNVAIEMLNICSNAFAGDVKLGYLDNFIDFRFLVSICL